MRIYDNGQYRDASPEEIALMERQIAEFPPQEPTPEERMAALEQQDTMLQECLLEMSEIIYA